MTRRPQRVLRSNFGCCRGTIEKSISLQVLGSSQPRNPSSITCSRPARPLHNGEDFGVLSPRKAWDAKGQVSSADVVLLKEAQRRYAGSNVENLYREWRQ